jgi:hypothetical protein
MGRRIHAVALGAAYVVACSPTSESLPDLRLLGGESEARAYRLGAEGPFIQHEMAIGQSADVAIENDGVRFIIRGNGGGDGYVPFAGWIVDAALAPHVLPAQYDGVDGFYPLVNLSPIGATHVTIERDGSDGGPAVVSVTGPLVAVADILGVQGAEPRPFPAEALLEYSLGPGENALTLRTRVLSTSQEVEAVDIGDVILFGDDEAEPFTLPAGFDQTSELREVDGIGSSHETRPVSYAVYAPETPLTLLRGSTVGGQLGGDGSLVGYTIESTLLEPGQVLEATRFLAVAPDVGGTLARRLDAREALTTPLTGTVRAAGEAVRGARVSVFSDPGLHQWVSQAISDVSGGFDLELEPGRYHVLATGRTTGEYVQLPGVRHELAEGYSPSDVQAVSIDAGEPEPIELALGPPARVRLEVRTAEGAALAAKVTFQAEDERPPLNPAAGERAPHRDLQVRQVVWTPNGDAELDLEPGLYTVTASHGPNAELDVRHGVELPAGEVTRLALRISEPVVHDGYVAIDPHVHGVYSQHGEATRLERVVTAAAEGLDVHVATDHDVIADYGPAVAAAGLDGVLTSIVGVELKTNNGDHCAWPLVRGPDEPLGGASRWWLEDRDLQKQYRYYAERGAIVMQIAHGASHFRSAGYDIATGSVSHPERFSFGFNAMEVHNGGGSGGRQTLMRYWISLIDFGHRVAPLAASDSHGRIPEVGVARTYVRTGAAGRDTEAVARATAALHTVASTGPFIELRTEDGAGPGDTRSAGLGRPLELVIRVWAPSWMRLDEVQLLAGGSELARWGATTEPPVALTPTPGLWLEEHVLVEPAEDEWYFVQAWGSVDLAPVYPGMLPWAVTAPLFVDADGDGEFRARCVRRPCPAP